MIPILDATGLSWSSDDYGLPKLTANLLAAAAVSPLVAQVRGYRTVTAANVRAFGLDHELGRTTTRTFRELLRLVDRGDLSGIPWHRAGSPAMNWSTGGSQVASVLEMCLSVPEEDVATGRMKHSVLMRGDRATPDAHPSTPASLLQSAPTVVVFDTVITADSALTAMLLVNGTKPES